MAVGLLEGLAAEAFGLAAVQVRMDGRLLAGGAAEGGVVTVDRHHKHRGCPAGAAGLPGRMQDSIRRLGGGLDHGDLEPLLPWADVQGDRCDANNPS